MNPGDTTSDIHLGTGAMALDCLPPDEAIEFTDHLSTCESCAAELVGFLETAALLGSAAAVTPPAGLRTSVLEAIRVTPQLPPLVSEPGGPAILGRHRTNEPATDTPEPTQSEAPPSNVVPLRRPWYRRPQGLIAAAAAVVVIAVGAFVLTRSTSNPGNSAANSCFSTASDVRTLAPASGKQGDVIYSQSCAQATVTPAGLAALPAGKVYQLWAIKGTDAAHARSLGLLSNNAGGGLKPTMVQIQSGESLVAVSVEPAGGSKEPTTTPVWAASLTS